MRSYIGLFHFEQVIEAVFFTKDSLFFGKNDLAKWILSQFTAPTLNTETPVHVIQGLLINLHKSRCLFETAEQHIKYMQDLLFTCREMFSVDSDRNKIALNAFIKSDMLEIVYNDAVEKKRVDVLALILSNVTIEEPHWRVCESRSASVEVIGSQIIAELADDYGSLKYLLHSSILIECI